MKRLGLVLGIVLAVQVQVAEAAWHDVIVVKQLKDITKCIAATSGGIIVDVVTGAKVVLVTIADEGANLVKNVATKIGECLIHTTEEITPEADDHTTDAG